ncbi:MAG TPA: tRNA (adenosine(37)-N6)-dimethylallyltransferase MiaA [Candidatus Thioglobus sp.]|nr:tRNA (adenosine(37)-N6)-dimethylallyltransferase MiaA [Candidatus Thioglobus sp.]HIL21425.1 tRNA (adenosine(37)-N6)-dimethylallyltransferase MiaA [Candidatus Thioglobus sp.]
MSLSPHNSVIFLMGPTASGKTELAIELCKHFDVHLISVDSALIYRTMDIGTAKPDAGTLQKYPHALVNICEPEDSFSVNDFVSQAKMHINLALEQNKLPVLVGGTSFYFHALEYGLSALPESTNESRQHFTEQLKALGSEELHKQLNAIDPIAANRIHCNDSQRVTRALEVYYLSGNTLSELQGNKDGSALSNPIKKIVLMPDRAVLHQRIEKRFNKMMSSGFMDEVKALRTNKKLNLDLPSIRCVGYRQAWQHLDGDTTESEMIEKSIIATRQLCKRQCTWLRHENNALTLADANIDKAIDFIEQASA